MKRESFVASFADVQVWLLEEQSGVASPPHQEFLTSALSSNRRRDSGITPDVAATDVDVRRERRAIPRGWGDVRFAVGAAGRRPACAGAPGTPFVLGRDAGHHGRG